MKLFRAASAPEPSSAELPKHMVLSSPWCRPRAVSWPFGGTVPKDFRVMHAVSLLLRVIIFRVWKTKTVTWHILRLVYLGWCRPSLHLYIYECFREPLSASVAVLFLNLQGLCNLIYTILLLTIIISHNKQGTLQSKGKLCPTISSLLVLDRTYANMSN